MPIANRQINTLSRAAHAANLFNHLPRRLAALARGYHSVALRAVIKPAQQAIRMLAPAEASAEAGVGVSFY